jgi:hypothetical protein
MKKIILVFLTIAASYSSVSFAQSYTCAIVKSPYSFDVDGATVDPSAGIFMTFLTDAGSGFELWEDEISSLAGYDFNRKTQCKVASATKGKKILKTFKCARQTNKGLIHLSSILEFDSMSLAGSYKGQVSGGVSNSFEFVFDSCAIK